MTITFQVNAVSAKYPYCQNQNLLFCTVLPVVWATPLYGEVLSDYNLLRRATAAVEEHIRGYWVERSTDANVFYPIGFVSAKGHSSDYIYRDEQRLLAARWMYRLRVEESGTSVMYSYSRALPPPCGSQANIRCGTRYADTPRS